ncbi:aldehyde-activating protein [Alteromonas ponticola]|uniref:Aldehyde-activating protein n=1 Tax=Alteromonas aquimaris TaxID=2998417 RepID=A0ABT3P7G4_9ALTE|nr:aldehyde-activating protein [Alteromonas aquimaris]MCW8108716.1 aldehyde-activating protein [Alteromonas aquimaris]
MDYSTECDCGKVKVLAFFPLPIENYEARECDCDFCVAHGLAYLSDVNGTISFYPKDSLTPLQQGSKQATFWQCRFCRDIVAVSYTRNGETRGAVPAALFDKEHKLKPFISVSPKKLSPTQKSERWSTLWSKVI